MIATRIITKTTDEFSKAFAGLFKFSNLEVPVEKIADYLATTLISRVRKSFMKQENPDGSKWPMSKAAAKRLGGGYTWTPGGPFGGGKRKVTGGNILFASGNLFHSIQLVKKGVGEYSIQTDVPYAQYYMNKDRTIIGTTPGELDKLTEMILSRLM